MCQHFISGKFLLFLTLLLLPIPRIYSADAKLSTKGQGGLPIYIVPSYPFDPVRNLLKDKDQPTGRAAEPTEEIEAEKVDEDISGTYILDTSDEVASESDNSKVQSEAVPTGETETADAAAYTEDAKPKQQHPSESENKNLSPPIGPVPSPSLATGEIEGRGRAMVNFRDREAGHRETKVKLGYHEDLNKQQPLLSSLFPRRGYFSGINFQVCRTYPTRLACRYYKRSPWSVSKYARIGQGFQHRQPQRPGFQFKEASPRPLLFPVHKVKKFNRFSNRK